MTALDPVAEAQRAFTMTLAIRRNLQAGGSPVAAADALLRLEGVLAAVVAGTTAFEAALLPSQHRPRLV